MNPGRNLMFLPGFFFFVAFGVLLHQDDQILAG